MQGKKRYLALVLFLLLGLVTFSFANPDEQLEPVEGNVKKVSEQKDEKRVQTKFEEAKELVEKAEQTPTPEIIAEAEEILEEAQQEQPELVQEEDLVNRLNNTEPAIDAAALINAVEKMIDEATKKDDVSAAKTYFDNNNVATVTNNLEDGTVKENLNIRVAYLVKVFADEIAPVITGIENNQTTNIDVALTISDDLDVNKKITLDGEEIEFKDTFEKEGTYVVTVTDDAQNTTSLTFTIDKTAIGIQSANMYTNGKKYTVDKETHYYATNGQKITAYVRLKEQSATLPIITLTIDGKEYVLENVKESFHTESDKEKGIYKYQGTYTIPEDMIVEDATVSYKITNITDKAGNTTTVSKVTNKNVIKIDTVKPKQERLAILGGKGYWFDKEYKRYVTNGSIVYVYVRTYEALAETPIITLNDTITLSKAGTVKETNGIWIYGYSYKVAEGDGLVDGTIQVKATNILDKAGNSIELTNADATMESQSEVIVDRTPATFKFYKEGSSLDKDEIQPTIIDGKLYFNQNVRVRFVEENSHFTQYIHNDFVNNENKTTIKTWTREAKNDGEHTMKVTDAAGNVTEVTFIIDTTAPTYKFYKEGSSLDKDEIQPTIVDGKLYFAENVRVRFTEESSFFTQYIHNDFVNNENKTTIKTWTREAKTDGEHTMKVTDAFGHVTEVTFVVDKTPNRVTQTFYRGSEVEGLKYYLTNGNKLQFNIGFRELLAEPAKVTIGGKEVELKYDKYYVATNSHMYYGYLEAAEDESDLVPGELKVEISNIVDYAGNKGFYYQTNGKKVYDTYKFTATTNGNVAIYKLSKAEVETVEEFVEAASKTSEITLLNDIELDSTIELPEDKDLVIDLNENTIELKDTEESKGQIKTKGNLTIKNGTLENNDIEKNVLIDKEDGTLTLEDIAIKDKASYSGTTIFNKKGKMIINNSSITIDSENTGCMAGDIEACGNTAIENYGDLTITNTTINSDASKRYGITTYSGNVVIDNLTLNVKRRGGLAIGGGDVTISNTTVSAYWYAIYAYNNIDTNITVNSGSFLSTGYSALYLGNANASNKGRVTINGGTFEIHTANTNSKKKYNTVYINEAAEGQDFGLTIKGGEFKALTASKVNPENYVADGYKVETISPAHKKVVKE